MRQETHKERSSLENSVTKTKTSVGQGVNPVFISKKQRFSSTEDFTPGPGTYNSLIKEKKTIDFRQTHQRNHKQPLQYAWIYGSGRNSFTQYTHIPGPGQYGQQIISSKDSSHSNWGKNRRFSYDVDKGSKLGPGSYQAAQSQKQTKIPCSSVFKSKSPKSFIDEIIMKSTKTFANPEEQLEVEEEITHFDETEYLIKKQVKKMSPVFLSKSKRSQFLIDNSPDKIGPGSYYPSEQPNTHRSDKKNVVSSIHYKLPSLTEKQKADLLNAKLSVPGPGSYNVQKIHKIAQNKPNLLVYKQQRFKSQRSQKTLIPGPGEYMQHRFTLINEQDFGLKHKTSKKGQLHHNFGLSQRVVLGKPNSIPFGNYNVNQFDIQTKIQKQKQHYEKLRMMEVTLPAFNTKHR